MAVDKEKVKKYILELNKRRLGMQRSREGSRKYIYIEQYKKGKHKKIIEEYIMGKREELLETLSAIGAKVTIKRQYSVGYQNLGMEIEVEADGYNEALELVELELMRQVEELPLDKIKEIDNEAKGSSGKSSGYSKPKQSYDKKPAYKKPYKKPYKKTQSTGGDDKPEGAQGSAKQWGIIMDDRNRDKLIEQEILDGEGNPLFDITDYNVIKDIVGIAMDNN